MLNICITSLERETGKTFITTGLAATLQSLGYKTCVYKPIQTRGIEINGFTQSPDFTYIKTIDPYINTHFSYLLKSSDEPLLGAEEENLYIDSDVIELEYKKLNSEFDSIIIDSDCGLLSPISPDTLFIDIIHRLQIPTILITTPSKNAINSTLGAINASESKGINIRGVLINNIMKDSSTNILTTISRTIEEYSNIKILGLVPHIENNQSPQDLITANLNGIDIESVFNVKIEKLDLN